MIPWRYPLLLWQLFSIAASAKKPNFLFILTDDQDWHMESLVRCIPQVFLEQKLLNSISLTQSPTVGTHALFTKAHDPRRNSVLEPLLYCRDLLSCQSHPVDWQSCTQH
jgi:hypothetical protein